MRTSKFKFRDSIHAVIELNGKLTPLNDFPSEVYIQPNPNPFVPQHKAIVEAVNNWMWMMGWAYDPILCDIIRKPDNFTKREFKIQYRLYRIYCAQSDMQKWDLILKYQDHKNQRRFRKI